MYNKKLKIVELFSGPGGLALGFHMAGFETLVAYEYEDDCINTYHANFPNTKTIKKDLHNFTKEDIDELKDYITAKTGDCSIDIVMGGPPCRSFSTANPKKKENDSRDYLYKTLIYVADQLNAKYFLMENVDDIGSKSENKDSEKKIFHCLLEDLYKTGFKYINFKVLNSADYGVPQTRERLIILATKDPGLPLTYPKPTFFKDKDPRWVTVNEAFEDLPKVAAPKDSENPGPDQHLLLNNLKNYYCCRYPKEPGNEYTKYCRGLNNIYGYVPFPWVKNDMNKLDLFIVPDHTERIIKRYSLLKEDENQGDLVRRLSLELPEEEFKRLIDEKIVPKKVFIQKNRKLPLNSPSRTVTSHAREELVHPVFNRNLVAKEVTRLQSFPDWYKFTGINQRPFKANSEIEIGLGRDYYQQAGDAVPPLLAAAVAGEIKNNILGSQKATDSKLREIIIRYIISLNIKIQNCDSKLKLRGISIDEILSGTRAIPEGLLDIVEVKTQKLTLLDEVAVE